VSVEIQDKLGEISELKTDMATVKDYIQRLESVIDSKFEIIHACLQKQSDFVGEHTKKSTYENFESKVVDLKSEFSKASKKITEEVKEIEKNYTTYVEKLDKEISMLKNMTQKLQTKITDDNITPSERSENTGSDELVTLQTANRFHVVQSDKTETGLGDSQHNPTLNNSNDPNFAVIWIIGTSLTQDLIPKKMYLNKKVRVTTLQDKTITGARNYIKSGKVQSDKILLQAGSNDLESKSPDEVIQELEDLISELKRELPNSKLIIAELLPRFYKKTSSAGMG